MRAWLALALAGCHAHSGAATVDGSIETDAAADAALDAAVTPLGLTCTATVHATTTDACPAPVAGSASFCFRPGWPGVTAVDVYGGFGKADDWTAPFLALADDGQGTFIGSAALADGSYPYLFRVHGADDNLVKDGAFLLDQETGQFAKAPAQAPNARSVSVVTLPQVAAPLRHLTGKLTYAGIPQPCFAVDLEVGELRDVNNHVLSEHGTANFIEVGPDGTFDFPVADGPVLAIARYPFGLAGGYPDPAATPALGVVRTAATVAGADVALDPADIAYADYAAMAPTAGSGTLPQKFTFSVVAGAQLAAMSVSKTNIAGNDPLFLSPFTGDSSFTWDGTFGNGQKAVTGTTYFWGSWQRFTGPTTTWTAESLLFPITFAASN